VKKRFSEEQIIGFLREADKGIALKELCRKHGFSGRVTTSGGASTVAWTSPTPNA
jgi:hypothetical protein